MHRSSFLLCLAITLVVMGCAGARYTDSVKTVDITQTPDGETTMRVLANADEWRSSGVVVNKGSTYRITAKGRWTSGAAGGFLGSCGWTGPDGIGISNLCYGSRFHILRGDSASILVGKIGDSGEPFVVGAELDLVADTDGALFFRINDAPVATGDNQGFVVVKTTVVRPRAPAVAAAPPAAPAPATGDARSTSASSGSGFLLRNTNLILTNSHVVRDRAQITISFPNGEEYPGQIVLRDRSNDLALVEARGLAASSRGLVVASSAEVKVGETVHALGYPLGAGLSRQPSMVSGTVSSTVGLEDDISRFRTTAPINPGSSGGPIVNDRGQVMGVAVSGLVREGVEAIRFGIKASSTASLLQQARLTTSFDIVVGPTVNAPRPPDQIFSELSPSVVLIETR